MSPQRHREAKILERDKCLKALGCKGPRTKADCHYRKWNNGTNWCIGANAICLGCTESGFPDKFSPFYKIEYAYTDYTDDEDPVDDSQLSITKAEWKKDKSELKVEGEGKVGAVVKVYHADSGVMFGAVSVASDGRWRFRQKNPTPIPGRVKVKSSGETMYANVKNTPLSASSQNSLYEKRVSAA